MFIILNFNTKNKKSYKNRKLYENNKLYNKSCALLLIIILSIVTSGCMAEIDTQNKIIPPEVENIPLQGEWQIEEKLTTKEEYGDYWIGKTIQIAKSGILIGDKLWDNVSFNIKRVVAEEYFLYKRNKPAQSMDKEVFVVNISSKGKFLYEIIKLSEDEAIIDIEEQYFLIKKISDKAGEEFSQLDIIKESPNEEYFSKKNKLSSSGILLGIRSASNINSLSGFEYKTLWISYQNEEIGNVYEAENIFLPRLNGFWMVGIKEIAEENREEILFAHRIPYEDARGNIDEKERNLFWNDKNGVLKRTILYAGNDFISIELSGEGSSQQSLSSYNKANPKWKICTYQTLPIDNIGSYKGIKISDIMEKSATISVQKAIESLSDTLNTQQLESIRNVKQDENFALFRKMGHWIFKSRLCIKSNGEAESTEVDTSASYQNYFINLIPPSKLVSYDELHVSWTVIKDKIPQAIDAYTSPNKDIIIVLTKENLLIYQMDGDNISQKTPKKIKISNKDSVIMAEWAIGDYVDKWEKSFLLNNKTKKIKFED